MKGLKINLNDFSDARDYQLRGEKLKNNLDRLWELRHDDDVEQEVIHVDFKKGRVIERQPSISLFDKKRNDLSDAIGQLRRIERSFTHDLTLKQLTKFQKTGKRLAWLSTDELKTITRSTKNERRYNRALVWRETITELERELDGLSEAA